jgi:seryl-tRNA synthetase
MHDISQIRGEPEAFDRLLTRRGTPPAAAAILERDKSLRAVQTELQQLRARRNDASREIGAAKAARDNARADALLAEVGELKVRLPELEEQERALSGAVGDILSAIPNLPADDVPEGADEGANVCIHERGERRSPGFQPLEHDAMAERLGYAPDTAAAIAGARFAILKGQVARLHRALGQFMLDLQTTEHGYTEVNVPLLVRSEAMFGTGQLPKFGEDSFQTTDGRWLIPTAEVSLTNMVRGQLLEADVLPLRLTALTPCFRSEAGAAGRDTRGLIRQHQFEKVELVSITRPEESEEEHERMTSCAEAVLDRLELPYRRMLLCTGDMGFSARKTYDLEVWLPGQGRYREISSCSNCGDFQARRMDARFRTPGEKGGRFVHTLNGSGLAVGRTLVAVLENYQEEDGSVTVPSALRPYMAGQDRLVP